VEDQKKFVEFMKPKFSITEQAFQVTSWADFDKEFTLKAHPHITNL
jgi:hypothetical protein